MAVHLDLHRGQLERKVEQAEVAEPRQILRENPREDSSKVGIAHDFRRRRKVPANGYLWPNRCVGEPLLRKLVDRRRRAREEESQS